jgi:hypothetical protein
MLLIGQLVGATILVTLLSLFLEWAIFKRVLDSPAMGIPAATAAAVALAIILYGFGNADGGPWNPMPGGLAYLVSGFIVAGIRLVGYRRREATREGTADTFE